MTYDLIDADAEYDALFVSASSGGTPAMREMRGRWRLRGVGGNPVMLEADTGDLVPLAHVVVARRVSDTDVNAHCLGCFICGDPDDHGGELHSLDVGDGRTRRSVSGPAVPAP